MYQMVLIRNSTELMYYEEIAFIAMCIIVPRL